MEQQRHPLRTDDSPLASPTVTTSTGAQPPQTAAARSPLLVLAASLIGISFAAPLIRLSSASALTIASWRLGFSLIIVAVALLLTGEWRILQRVAQRDVRLTMAAGCLLALHFWSWNQSLRYTSIAASVSLVNLQPVIIAAFSARWLGEPPSRRQWSGIAIAVVGALVVGLADVPGGPGGIWRAITAGAASDGAASTVAGDAARRLALWGDLLACVGAVTGALYFLIGRRVRQTMPLWPYVSLVYSAAFVLCVLLAIGAGDVLYPQAPRDLALFAGLALGPMLLGHTGMNWALGHLPAYLVNLTTLGEPIGATVLGLLLPGIQEVPSLGTVLGAALVLVGVVRAAQR